MSKRPIAHRANQKRVVPAALAGLAALACLSSAQAFQPLITDDTGTQGKGGSQLEFSANRDGVSAGGSTTRILSLPLVFTHGISDTADIYAAAARIDIAPADRRLAVSGSGNPAIGAKWRFYEDEDSKTSVALKPEVRLPISAAKENAGLGTGRTSYGLALIASREFSFGAIHANLARGRDLFLDPDTNPHVSVLRASIAPVWNIGESWKLVIDLGRESQSSAGARTQLAYVEAGCVYSDSKDLDFSFGLIRRIDNSQPRATTTSASLGVTWRF